MTRNGVTDYVLLFAKAPLAGQVKTRLAQELGVAGAYRAHCMLLLDALRRLDGGPWQYQLWMTADTSQAQAWSAEFGYALRQQAGDNLGRRMAHAMGEAFAAGAQRVVLLGADCPSINLDYLTETFTALCDHDVVLGPAADGGYGLIGSKRPIEGAFQGIRWGTGEVFDQSIKRCRSLGLNVYVGQEIWDVDEPTDWQRYQALTH